MSKVVEQDAVPGQIELGLDLRVSYEDVLKGLDLKGLSLDFALSLQQAGGNIPDEQPLYSLSFWKKGSREAFLKAIEQIRQWNLDKAQESLRLWNAERSAGNLSPDDPYANRSIQQANAVLEKYGAPLSEDSLVAPTQEWSEMITGLAPYKTSIVGRILHVAPADYYNHPEKFQGTVGDVRAKKSRGIDLGGRVFGKGSMENFIRHHAADDIGRGIFLPVALSKPTQS